MKKSGVVKFAWGSVTMVGADHSSTCGIHDGNLIDGGNPAGFILRFNTGEVVYHSGDTGVFGDMALIDELYEPTILLLTIGDINTMGPEEAAFACHRFFKHAKWVIPMHFATIADKMPDTYPEFVQLLKNKYHSPELKVIDSYAEALGRWLDLH